MNDGKFYDPSEVRLIVNGIDITGFSDGEKIKIEPVTKELYKSHCGVDGDTSFTKVHDNRHTITFTLKQGSRRISFSTASRSSRPACGGSHQQQRGALCGRRDRRADRRAADDRFRRRRR